ncbi:peptidyl-prolyl cis-trans isomerase [Spirochaetia bacterium]|nr:peptidyl-prolyl cis-trans isomerase [Spirochaetia bacterium]
MIKRTVIAILLATIVLFACSAGGKKDTGTTGANGASQLTRADADTSYAFGMYLGADLKSTGLTFNYNEFVKGFQASLEGKELRLSEEAAIEKIQAALAAAMRAKETAFLAENGAKNGVTTTASGLQYEVISQGNGAKPGPDDTVEIHYEGTLTDGTVFDSSYDRGEPTEFPLYEVIPGMTEGLQLMNVGGKYKLYIPSGLAYGDQGGGPIPPGSTLIFTIELLSIVK